VAGPAKAGFRETAWFKAGEIEEELAKAQAANASTDPLAPTGTTGQHEAVDPSKLEITAADKARLSLKTGNTQVMAAIKPGVALPGERMDEKEMAAEFGGGSKKWVIIAAAAAVVVIGLVLALTMGGGSKKPEEKKSEVAPGSSVVSPA
jgi:hypothetical protein